MLDETATLGNGLTVTVTVFALEQPDVVPVTVNIIVEGGVTLILLVVDPVFQLYVVAPVAAKTAVAPLQIVGLFTETVGEGVTDTLTVFVLVHPDAVPVTV